MNESLKLTYRINHVLEIVAFQDYTYLICPQPKKQLQGFDPLSFSKKIQEKKTSDYKFHYPTYIEGGLLLLIMLQHIIEDNPITKVYRHCDGCSSCKILPHYFMMDHMLDALGAMPDKEIRQDPFTYKDRVDDITGRATLTVAQYLVQDISSYVYLYRFS